MTIRRRAPNMRRMPGAHPSAVAPQPPIARSLPLLIAALSMIGPFAIDTYLPSFREMEHSLGASALQVQQSLTAYLIPFALMSLWHGSISDALGRRRVVLISLVVLAITSIGCALAPSIHALWFFRALQGIASGAGMVVGRAVVRDVYDGHAAQRVMANVTMIFTVAPAIAPVLGGWLHEWFGWRSVFWFLAAFAAALLVWCGVSLPETLHAERRQPLNAGYLARAYLRTLTHTRFIAVAFAAAFNFTAIFLYISAAPVFLMRHLGLHETQFYWLFIPAPAGLMIGAGLSGRLAGRLSGARTVWIGFAIMLAATAANVVFHTFLREQLPWSVAPIFV
ncbi:MAG: multidrug effflux MFS transporter, partial [Verrucomicrobiota bacterium]|nr:multidrug effflux MFS transporter [Verrucomicrobiota bacterium]